MRTTRERRVKANKKGSRKRLKGTGLKTAEDLREMAGTYGPRD
jgi:hypothetical protein